MDSMGHFTAFAGHRRVASGPLGEVALAIKHLETQRSTQPVTHPPILIFDDTSGRSIDIDLRGTDEETLARLPRTELSSETDTPAASGPRGRGRPKLGVVARAATPLPRHWDWIWSPPTGAAVIFSKHT